MVTLVIVGESKAASVTVYGSTPPVIVKPQGWQVVKLVVTLAWTVKSVEGAGSEHEVLLPARCHVSGYTEVPLHKHTCNAVEIL
jgi:hypothetical protein